MPNTFIHKILKYLALALAIYLIFRLIPNFNASGADILLLTTVIILVCLLLESLCNYFSFNSTENFMSGAEKSAMCSSVCATRSEHMENVPQTPPPIEHKVLKVVHEVLTVPEPVKPVEKPEIKVIQDTSPKPIMDDSSEVSDDSETVFQRSMRPGIEQTSSRPNIGTVLNDLKYSDFNHLPMAENYNKGDFEFGYSFLPPEQWYPQPPFPPVCVTDKKCPVCPVFTNGTPIDVKEWNESRRITQPDEIKTDYIRDVLNSGR